MGEYTFAISSIDEWNGLIFYEILDGPRKKPVYKPVIVKQPVNEPNYFVPVIVKLEESAIIVSRVFTTVMAPIIIVPPSNDCLTCPVNQVN